MDTGAAVPVSCRACSSSTDPGCTRSPARTFESRNPATGEVLGEAADAGAEDAQTAVEAAKAAFPSFAKLTAHERSAYLYEAWRIMTERREDLAQLMTKEQGKPLRMSRNEVGYAADFLLWFAEEAKRVYGATIPSSRADQRFLTMYQPVGVAAAITPWNYPISMLTTEDRPGPRGWMHHRRQARRADAAVRGGDHQGVRGRRLAGRESSTWSPRVIPSRSATSSFPTGRSARSPSPGRPRSASTSPSVPPGS